mgnify:CR=1 FL=1
MSTHSRKFRKWKRLVRIPSREYYFIKKMSSIKLSRLLNESKGSRGFLHQNKGKLNKFIYKDN